MRNIIIHNDFNKKMLELTEDELIIKQFLHRKRVKRSNIRSAYINQEFLNILTYDNKLIVVGSSFIKWGERENIKRIVDEVNKENIIFNFGRGYFPWWAILFYSTTALTNIINNWGDTNYLYWIVFITMLILSVIVYKENRENKIIKYYISEGKFMWEKNKGKIINSYSKDSVKLVKDYDMLSKYKVKNKKKTFYFVNRIDYPLSHKFALEELRDVDSEEMSINK